MDSAGARSSEADLQHQRWSAYVTSAGRQDGGQARDVPAPIPSHQSERQELRTRTPQSTSLTREQEWSEQVPAAVRPSETEELSIQPLRSRYRFRTHLVRRTTCPILCGIGGMRIHRSDGQLINGAGTKELPARQRINKIVIGTNGAAGIPAVTGLPSWPTRADDERWSSWSPWSNSVLLESKKYFDKSPPPEWDGNQPEKDLARKSPHVETMVEHHRCPY